MPKSLWDKRREGSYDVNIKGQMNHQTSYHDHYTHVEYATSPRDAYNQAKSGLNPNMNIVKVVVVFLGVATLIALSQGWIVF